MKKMLFIALMCAVLSGCSDSSDTDDSSSGTICGTHNGKTLYRGRDGGCYYLNGNGNKTYVERSECTCR